MSCSVFCKKALPRFVVTEKKALQPTVGTGAATKQSVVVCANYSLSLEKKLLNVMYVKKTRTFALIVME